MKVLKNLWFYPIVFLSYGIIANILFVLLGGDYLDGLAGAPLTNTSLDTTLLRTGAIAIIVGVVLVIILLPIKLLRLLKKQ